MTIERPPVTGAPIVLVADGDVQNALPPSLDPVANWFDLMEALCPEWVERKAVGMAWVCRVRVD